MSLKSIIATPLFLVVAASAGAAEQTRQTTVVQDMAPGATAQPGNYAGTHILYQDVAIPSTGGGAGASKPTPAGSQRYADVPPGTFVEPPTQDANKFKAPSGGTKLPAVQKVREAVNRTPQAGAHHSGGINVVLGDGSVRNSVSPVGGNETISIGSGSTETAKGGGANELKLDDTAGAAKAPKPGSLGSLQGMNSIGQLAAPQGGDQAAGREVRHRMFAIVDRTATAKDGSGAGTGKVGSNETIKIGGGRTETTAGGGPHVKAFSGNDGAGGRAPGNITPKGQAIKQN